MSYVRRYKKKFQQTSLYGHKMKLSLENLKGKGEWPQEMCFLYTH